MRKFVLASLIISSLNVMGQEVPEIDTPAHKYLPELTIVGRSSKSDYHQMPEVVGTNIYAGKKNAPRWWY